MNSYCTKLQLSKNILSMIFIFDLLCHAFLGHGDNFAVHCENCCFILSLCQWTHILSAVIINFMKGSMHFSWLQNVCAIFSCFSFCSTMRSHGMNFAEACCMTIFSVIILKHDPSRSDIFMSLIIGMNGLRHLLH
jgi:hypothetical protein